MRDPNPHTVSHCTHQHGPQLQFSKTESRQRSPSGFRFTRPGRPAERNGMKWNEAGLGRRRPKLVLMFEIQIKLEEPYRAQGGLCFSWY